MTREAISNWVLANINKRWLAEVIHNCCEEEALQELEELTRKEFLELADAMDEQRAGAGW